jgi:hypothetical protein
MTYGCTNHGLNSSSKIHSYLDCSQNKLNADYLVLKEIFVADLLSTFRFAKSIDICDKDAVVHKHTPYIVILVRLAEKWADAHDGQLPSTRQEKREFKVHGFLGLLAE